MTSAKPILIFGSLALAVLGAALAVVAQRPVPTPPPPVVPAEFAPFQAETPGAEPTAEQGSAGRTDSPADTDTDTEPSTAQAADPTQAAAVTPTPTGPSVGVNPARAEEPIQLLNPVEYRQPEGTANPGDPRNENDPQAGRVSREETFANNIQAQYEAVTQVMADCVEGMPAATRDTVHVEMVVRDAPGGQRGVGSIENFQSATLADDREACARRGFEQMDLPLPWLATAIEAPGFTVVADTAVEYSLEFEVEIGAE